MKGIAETSEEEWDAVVTINQKGVWLGMKAAIPAMRKRGGGSIVNISSIYGLIGSAGATAYHGTKGAVRLLTKAAAVNMRRKTSASTLFIRELSKRRWSRRSTRNRCGRSPRWRR